MLYEAWVWGMRPHLMERRLWMWVGHGSPRFRTGRCERGAEMRGRVAVVGTGRMGGAMATRLRAGGVGVTVFNRTADRAAAVAERTGADHAPTARDAVAAAEVVLVSLADDAACEAAYDGPDGILAGVHAGTLVVDTS